jgi:hypothetical protein
LGFAITGEGCDLKRSSDFKDLSSCDAKDARLVCGACTASSLCCVETDTLRCAECLVPELAVLDGCIAYTYEQLQGDVIGDEAMARKKTVRGIGLGHTHSSAGIVTANCMAHCTRQKLARYVRVRV